MIFSFWAAAPLFPRITDYGRDDHAEAHARRTGDAIIKCPMFIIRAADCADSSFFAAA